MSMSEPVALARKKLSAVGMWIFGATASAPIVVLVGGIVATYGGTGEIGLPLIFLVVGTAVTLLAVGYAAMSREVPHAAAYYAILARGLGRHVGVAGGVVALIAYNAIQISLYGLLGWVVSGLFGGTWWVWAEIALIGVALLGLRRVVLSTAVLAVVLVFSFFVVFMFIAASLTSPAAGALSWEGFSPASISAPGLGGAAALCLAALMGFDAPGSLAEEAIDDRAVTRSTIAGAVSLTGAYTLIAFAMGVAVGPGKVAAVANDPNGGLPFSVMEQHVGGYMTPLANTVLVFGIVASMLALHNVIARYTLAMAREGVLPKALASVTDSRSPKGGSLLQSAIATILVAAFAFFGADPQKIFFTWLSTLGALGLLVLLLAAGVAAIAHFARHRGHTGVIAASTIGITVGLLILGAMITNMGSLLGAADGALLPLLLPLIIVIGVVAGLAWAGHLRYSDPQVFRGISQGRPDTYAVPDDVDITF